MELECINLMIFWCTVGDVGYAVPAKCELSKFFTARG